MAEFVYSPLKHREIRLLSLLPKKPLLEEILQCKMIHVSLDDQKILEYSALSYTWGDPTIKFPILINNKTFNLHENAYQALSTAVPEVHLWIDAICINQDDKNEKSTQVPLMKDVYSLASSVDVWLGPTADNSDFAIEFIEELREILPSISPLNVYGYNVASEIEHKTNSKIGDQKWMAVNKLFERSWFSRVWVVQEVALSGNGNVQFLCGDASLTWDSLVDFLNKLLNINAVFAITKPNPDPSDYMGATRLPAAWRQVELIIGLARKRESGSLDLADAIQYGILCKATDQRDKIYGLYGLAGVDDPKIASDYNKSTQQVYIDISRYLMVELRSLNLLSDAGISYNDRLSSLPSWVPNLNVNRNPRLGAPSPRAYNAGGGSQPTFHWETGDNELTVRGCLLDTVAQYTSYISYTPEGYRPSSALGIFFREVAQLIVQHGFDPEQEAVQDSLMRTLVADRDASYKPLPADSPSAFAAFVEYLQHPTMYADGFSYQGKQGADPAMDQKFTVAKHAQQFVAYMENCQPQRRFCVTKGRRMGLVPTATRPGDVIAIFCGATVPFVLRKTKGVDEGAAETLSNDEKYELIGEAYVHGLMDGEGMKQGNERNITIQ